MTFSVCENVERLDSSKKEKTFCTNWTYFSSFWEENVEGCLQSCNEQSGEILSRCLPYATRNERALNDLEKKRKALWPFASVLLLPVQSESTESTAPALWVDVEDDGHAHIFKYITQSGVWVLKTGSQSSRWEILVAFTEEGPGAPAQL